MDREDRLNALAEQFEQCSPQEILAWAVSEYSPDIAMSTGFGPSGIVLMHIMRQMGLDIPVFYIDTGFLFPEVHQLRALLEQTLGVRFERVVPTLDLEEQAQQFGEKLWERDPDTCCWLRKVLPLQAYLRGKRAWVSAIRADQTPYRSRAKLIEWDERNQVVKINPLLRWSKDRIWEYIRHHRLPYNPLHDQGYPSVGCIPCTTPICEGEDLRAGRWRGKAKFECGIHFQKG
ncbi:MAG: phosphoadenylyl-sulfate reductase [Anaerolineales bacterium]|nr:phosphoadenylyl-sulfate reductase [Anaerolineales bacterium]MCS7247005.1 phosphoadenylyl-sulfate reductase [Anaerolineales bacterium]MDW8160816.1 phosphoadenylyl-sulfate reductase [Anaerolineales bacterium]MDW8447390.1 phosphoadenylyl-sulfate reductase [Anaerolineales bacterium]